MTEQEMERALDEIRRDVDAVQFTQGINTAALIIIAVVLIVIVMRLW